MATNTAGPATTGTTGTRKGKGTGTGSAGGRGGSSIRLGQPVDTLGALKGQVQEAGTQVEQLQAMLAPVKAWGETLPSALEQAPWRSEGVGSAAQAIAALDPMRPQDLPGLREQIDAALGECERLQAAGDVVQAVGATGDAAWHQQH